METDSIRIIVDAVYEWRSAEVHAAACHLDIREDKSGKAEEKLEEKLRNLRIVLDMYREELK